MNNVIRPVFPQDILILSSGGPQLAIVMHYILQGSRQKAIAKLLQDYSGVYSIKPNAKDALDCYKHFISFFDSITDKQFNTIYLFFSEKYLRFTIKSEVARDGFDEIQAFSEDIYARFKESGVI